MSKNNKVLVLSEDDAKRRDISTILEFIGEEGIVVGADAHSLLSSGDAEDLESISVAVVNGEDDGVTAVISTVCEVAQGVPLLLVGDPDLAGLSDDETSRVIARMEWPLNYTKFVDSL